MLEAVKETLGDEVKEVRVSSILKSGAVCLTADGPVSLEMEKYMQQGGGRTEHMKAQRVLELNPDSAPFAALQEGGGGRGQGHGRQIRQAALRPGSAAGRPASGGPGGVRRSWSAP